SSAVAPSTGHAAISDTVTATVCGALTHPAGAAFVLNTASAARADSRGLLAGNGAAPIVARTQAAGVTLVGHTASAALTDGTGATACGIALAQPLLCSPHARAGSRVSSSALVAVGDVTVIVRNIATVNWIVNPVVSVTNVYPIKVIASDEVVVDHDIVAAAPSAPPSVAAPTAATTPDGANRHADSKRDRAGGDNRAG